MPNIDLLITVDDNYTNRISEVVKRLEDMGMMIERTMEEVGIIAGSIDEAKIEAISNIEGVMTVEESMPSQLPPPESDLW